MIEIFRELLNEERIGLTNCLSVFTYKKQHTNTNRVWICIFCCPKWPKFGHPKGGQGSTACRYSGHSSRNCPIKCGNYNDNKVKFFLCRFLLCCLRRGTVRLQRHRIIWGDAGFRISNPGPLCARIMVRYQWATTHLPCGDFNRPWCPPPHVLFQFQFVASDKIHGVYKTSFPI